MEPEAALRRMCRTPGVWAMVGLLLAVSCGSGAAEPASSGEVATTAAAAPETAEPAPAGDHRPVPEVRFDYFDGSEGTLADLAGTPAVINFWASWCPPCITEMPAFEAVHVELAPQVAFLGFNVGDEPGAARELAERTGVTYPLAEDPDSTIFQAFGGFGMPTTVLVDAEGMIVHMISSRLRAQDLRALIAEHLGV
ncbi:MAG: TlpA family protein disulfide reductase [Acidimicrobiia bacterium]|nr:TlpA family protein disulfide reductase [Acidimicrobiia bacterium]MYI18719.1 TlpA family protein disulfide reductase [Acidimicrobiia bacterium]